LREAFFCILHLKAIEDDSLCAVSFSYILLALLYHINRFRVISF